MDDRLIKTPIASILWQSIIGILFFRGPSEKNTLRLLYLTDKGPDVDTALSLGALLTDCAMFKATDPIDRTFALLGLAINVPHDSLTANYLKPVYEIYTDVAHYLLLKDDPFSTFGFAGIG